MLSRWAAYIHRAAAHVRRWVQRSLISVLFVVAAGIAVGILVYVFEGSGLPSTAQSRSVLVRNVGLVLGGLAALWVAVWRSRVADRQANATQQDAATGQQRLLDDRLQQAAAMLASNLLPVRLGGIYALQRLAEEQPEEYHTLIMHMLCAFVRQPPTDDRSGTVKDSLREDVQAAVAVISRCHERQHERAFEFTPDLRSADLRYFRFTPRASRLPDESDTPVPEAVRDKVRHNLWSVQRAFAHVDACGVFLRGADLRGADLRGADLERAILDDAKLDEAHLSLAFLFRASLKDASLTGADLTGASLHGAGVSGARFSRDDLYDDLPILVDLSVHRAKGLTQADLDNARADPAKPPILDGVLDAETGEQLVWRDKPLDDTEDAP